MSSNDLSTLESTRPGARTTQRSLKLYPFNEHFPRDIGIIFLFTATAFLVGAARPKERVFLWGAATLWLSGHALFHFWEVAVGSCAPSAIPRDFPAVTLPAILGAALTLWAEQEVRAAPADG